MAKGEGKARKIDLGDDGDNQFLVLKRDVPFGTTPQIIKDNYRVQLGDKVKDTLTGFVGTVTIRSINIHGCDRLVVDPPVDKDGKLPDGHIFDEQRLEVLERQGVPVASDSVPEKTLPGGPTTRHAPAKVTR